MKELGVRGIWGCLEVCKEAGKKGLKVATNLGAAAMAQGHLQMSDATLLVQQVDKVNVSRVALESSLGLGCWRGWAGPKATWI
jgi:hypothetical protein